MNIEENLTEQSKKMYQELLDSGYKIEFESDMKYKNDLKGGSFGMKPMGDKKFKIVTSLTEPTFATEPAFAHELLHIYLFTKGFKDFDEIKLFSEDFVKSVNNSISHYKMVDAFVKLGFNKEYFLNETIDQFVQNINCIINSVCSNDFAFIFSVTFTCLFYKDNYCENDALNKLIEDLQHKNNLLFNIACEAIEYWKNLKDADNLAFFTFLKKKMKENNIPIIVDAKHIESMMFAKNSNYSIDFEKQRRKLNMEIAQLQGEYNNTQNPSILTEINAKLQELQSLNN